MINIERTNCWWVLDEDGIWQTGCENAFVFIEEGPRENGLKFCPYCGANIRDVVAGEPHANP